MLREMAVELDDVDILLAAELERDADRTNVDLARVAELSPAATLHRVRRLKDTGVIRRVTAELDPEALGFPLHVYLTVTIGRHDQATHDRLRTVVESIDQVLWADWIGGETDVLMSVVSRSVAELQQVQLQLSSKGGAQRITTLLRLEVLKGVSPLPLAPADARRRARRR